MNRYFETVKRKLPQIDSDVEARIIIIANVRLLLQTVNFGVLEWISAQRPSSDLQPTRETLNALLAPSDGTLVDSLDSLLITAEQNGWTGAYRSLLHEIRDNDPCLDILDEHSNTLGGLLRAIVELRNDGGEGHGLPGAYQRVAEEAAFRCIVDGLIDVTPRIASDGKIAIGPLGREVRLQIVRAVSRSPILVRKIKRVSSETIRVQGQYYDKKGTLEIISYETNNIFSSFRDRPLPSLSTFENSWAPLCYLPDRVTDTFTGRSGEIDAIVDWLNDVEERACLVFGDGGVGKTTLVIEAIHRVLEEDISVSWKPKAITFYTAKRSQFGADGLMIIGAGRPHLLDLLVHLHILFLGRHPASDFYRKDVRAAAVHLQELMRSEISLTKSEHLLIIDNAETLIESDEERDVLGGELKEIARRVGRILITSRRREILGANPVALKPLSKVESVFFLKSRGVKLNLVSLKKASDEGLLNIVEALDCKPIVLEAFVSSLADPIYGTLDKAKNRVLGMLSKDLGTFLFADAWGRFSRDIRGLLIFMTRIGDVLDAQQLRICCDQCGVQVLDAEKALQESSGIASIINIDGGLQISFSKNFLDFCRGKEPPSMEKVSAARSAYGRFLALARTYSGDRMAEAFRTATARAAHQARNNGDLKQARELYEQAILADSTNGLLHDRYAYFLLRDFRDPEPALHQSKAATQLLPQEGEVWLTRGLIEARMGDVRAAELSLNKAESLGVSSVRCGIQRAWAYLKCKPRQVALAERQLTTLESATSGQPPLSRDRVEIGHIRERLQAVTRKRLH